MQSTRALEDRVPTSKRNQTPPTSSKSRSPASKKTPSPVSLKKSPKPTNNNTVLSTQKKASSRSAALNQPLMLIEEDPVDAGFTSRTANFPNAGILNNSSRDLNINDKQPSQGGNVDDSTFSITSPLAAPGEDSKLREKNRE